MTAGQVDNPTPQYDLDGNLTGYYNINLMKNGKTKTNTLHSLVGITQCDNALKKTEIHHIKPIDVENMKISELQHFVFLASLLVSDLPRLKFTNLSQE